MTAKRLAKESYGSAESSVSIENPANQPRGFSINWRCGESRKAINEMAAGGVTYDI